LTTGFEEESFVALQHAVHGEPVYRDPSRIPYSAAYFNWFFYAAYAIPVRMAVARYGDSIIPMAGRLVTAVGSLLGAGILACLLGCILQTERRVAAGLAALVCGGPLIGWWAHTLRPDVWTMTFETGALAVILLRYRPRPIASALCGALLFYLAWSCKQTAIMSLASAGLFLLWRREWRAVLMLGTASVLCWAATFLILGPAYRSALFSAAATNPFYLDVGLTNFLDFLKKTIPLWLLAGACLIPGDKQDPDSSLAADARLLGAIGVLVSMPVYFAASCKFGAFSNYFFTPVLLLSLFLAGSLAAHPRRLWVAAAFAISLVIQLIVSFGLIGKIDLQPQARDLAAVWAKWQTQPEPRFSVRTNLNAPWLNSNSPPFVLAFSYYIDREAGRRFEGDGIGGLIATGYFESLLLPEATTGEFDGGSLSHYARTETIDGLAIYRRLKGRLLSASNTPSTARSIE
jgi:hypothetical protein